MRICNTVAVVGIHRRRHCPFSFASLKASVASNVTVSLSLRNMLTLFEYVGAVHADAFICVLRRIVCNLRTRIASAMIGQSPLGGDVTAIRWIWNTICEV